MSSSIKRPVDDSGDTSYDRFALLREGTKYFAEFLHKRGMGLGGGDTKISVTPFPPNKMFPGRTLPILGFNFD